MAAQSFKSFCLPVITKKTKKTDETEKLDEKIDEKVDEKVDYKVKPKLGLPPIIVTSKEEIPSDFIIKSPKSDSTHFSFIGHEYNGEDKDELIELIRPFFDSKIDWRCINWKKLKSDIIDFIVETDQATIIKLIALCHEMILHPKMSFKYKLYASNFINVVLTSKYEILTFEHVQNLILSILFMDTSIDTSKPETMECVNSGKIKSDLKFIYLYKLLPQIKIDSKTYDYLKYIFTNWIRIEYPEQHNFINYGDIITIEDIKKNIKLLKIMFSH